MRGWIYGRREWPEFELITVCVIESVVNCSEILQVKFLLYVTEGVHILCVG